MLIFLSLIFLSCSTTQSSSASTIYSKIVKDSFEVYVDLPVEYKKGSDYSVVLYMDANLKMGKEIRRQLYIKDNRKNLSNVIFIGIGHIGNYRELRRRDFIPAEIKGKDTIVSKDLKFGHAEKFYGFLTRELIPHINENYPNNGNLSFIGHSFSGLFGFYCLMKPDVPFINIIAMSPSLWVNYDNFFKIEENFYKTNSKFKYITLYHTCGGAEWMNKVLYSSRRMRDALRVRNYTELKYIYQEYEGKNHNGTVKPSIEYVLKNIQF